MPALGLDFERTVRAQPSEVRRAISAALGEAGMQMTAEQLTRVEAKRGSRLLGGSLMPARVLPILASFDILADAAGCAVSGHFTDNHITVGGKAWGWNQTYQQLFGEILAGVDRGLARLDPEAAASFPPARFWTRGGGIALLEQAQTLGSHAGAAVAGKATVVLEGGPRDRGPAAWKGLDSVTFAATRGSAVLSLAETQAHLGIGVMIVAQPGALPANLQGDVERFAARVEATLTNAPGRAVTIEVTDPERPVFEFLHQQVRIRGGLPVRTLRTCRTCHFQRVTNEDFARLQTRNQHLRSLVGGVGATISSGGIQPFVLVGQLFKLKKLDPDFVCPRCQGMGADERVVTFCPECGELRQEAVLRSCGKCAHDFRAALPDETLWLTVEAAAALVAPPQEATAALVTPPYETAAPYETAPAGPAEEVGTARSALPPAATPVAGSIAFCPFCGVRVVPGYAFCATCGERIDPSALQPGGPSA